MSGANPLADYLSMGGYAAYVWPAYILAMAAIGGLALQTHLEFARWKKRLLILEDSRENSVEHSGKKSRDVTK